MKFSSKAIDWINNHEDLIDSGDIDNIVENCLPSIVHEVIWALVECGVELNEQATSSMMWGIKKFDGYRTLSLGKHNKTNFNVNFTASEGMKGGFQIGFKSIKDCIAFMQNFDEDIRYKYRPSKMQPKTVASYDWQEVDTIYGKCWVTNVAFKFHDPAAAAARKLQKKVDSDIYKKVVSYMKPICEELAEYISKYVDPKYKNFLHLYADVKLPECVYLTINCLDLPEDKFPEFHETLEKISKLTLRLRSTYIPSYDEYAGYITSVYFDLNDNKFYKDIVAEVHNKYGIV